MAASRLLTNRKRIAYRSGGVFQAAAATPHMKLCPSQAPMCRGRANNGSLAGRWWVALTSRDEVAGLCGDRKSRAGRGRGSKEDRGRGSGARIAGGSRGGSRTGSRGGSRGGPRATATTTTRSARPPFNHAPCVIDRAPQGIIPERAAIGETRLFMRRCAQRRLPTGARCGLLARA